MYLRPIFLGIFSFLILTVGRGEMISPLKIPLLMSANFGELRPNHFHSGIDLKTQGRIGLPVYAMDDGYVSRVVVSPWGFGRAVYINHSSGLTTVYGHLDRFAPFIDEIVRRQQYEQEDFSIDCEFAEGEIPVAQGDIIGYSGNSGIVWWSSFAFGYTGYRYARPDGSSGMVVSFNHRRCSSRSS